jgi:hypothetical protein
MPSVSVKLVEVAKLAASVLEAAPMEADVELFGKIESYVHHVGSQRGSCPRCLLCSNRVVDLPRIFSIATRKYRREELFGVVCNSCSANGAELEARVATALEGLLMETVGSA